MKLKKDDIFTGLFVVGGAILALITLFTILGYNVLEDRISYTVRMDSLAGIKKGTKIQWNNFTVGKVIYTTPIYGTDIYFKAIVSIDRALRLYRGSKINITKENIIGDTVMNLVASINKNVLLKEDDTLFATSITNLDEMVNNVNLILKNVSGLLGQFNGMAGSNKQYITGFLTGLNQTVGKVNNLLDATQTDVFKILRNLQSTSKTLDRFSKAVENNPMMLLQDNSGKKTKKSKVDKKSFFP